MPTPTPNSRSYWLAPDGTLTPAGQRTHEQLAYELGRRERDGREAMIRDGRYVRVVVAAEELNVDLWRREALTAPQRAALLELYTESACASAVMDERATGESCRAVGLARFAALLAGAAPEREPGA